MVSFERAAELSELRRQVLAQSLYLTAGQYSRGSLTGTDTAELDAAVLALADKLREPETCRACGQEVHAVPGVNLRAEL